MKNQEELKGARAALKVLHSELDLEKIKVGRRDQEAFTAQYQLVGVQEELAQAQARIKAMEVERDALKMSLKEEEVARIAAEGQIPLPQASNNDEDLISPIRSLRSSPARSTSDNELSSMMQAMQQLQQDLSTQRKQTEQAEERIEFMKMECQFRCCSCRVAEAQGKAYIHDPNFSDRTTQVTSSNPPAPAHLLGKQEDCKSEPSKRADTREARKPPIPRTPHHAPTRAATQHPAPITTSKPQRPSEHPPHPPVAHKASTSSLTSSNSAVVAGPAATRPQPPRLPSQLTDFTLLIDDASLLTFSPTQPRTHTPPPTSSTAPQNHLTTQTVPLIDHARNPDYATLFTPAASHLTREEAMEQIRRRRGRERSITAEARASSSSSTASRAASAIGVEAARGEMLDVMVDRTPRRDGSAPEIGRGTRTPATGAIGGGGGGARKVAAAGK